MILQFTAFEWKCHSPQVNFDMISIVIGFVLEFPHKLLNELKLRSYEVSTLKKTAKVWFGYRVVHFAVQKSLFWNSDQNLHKKYQILLILSNLYQKCSQSLPVEANLCPYLSQSPFNINILKHLAILNSYSSV